MPELPDITLYIEALTSRLRGVRLERARVASPFLLRSVEPSMGEAVGAEVTAIERLGKRIAIGFSNDLWFVTHLMIAGRLQWREAWPAKITRQTALVLGFTSGTLLLTFFFAVLVSLGLVGTYASLSSRPKWKDCGNDAETARLRGCSFDLISFAWQTPECYDGELVADFAT